MNHHQQQRSFDELVSPKPFKPRSTEARTGYRSVAAPDPSSSPVYLDNLVDGGSSSSSIPSASSSSLASPLSGPTAGSLGPFPPAVSRGKMSPSSPPLRAEWAHATPMQMEGAPPAPPTCPPPTKPRYTAGYADSGADKPAVTAVSMDAPRFVKLYDEILDGPFAEFLKLSGQIGGDVKEMADLVSLAFSRQREFVWRASGATKPSAGDLPAMLTPTSDAITAIQQLKDRDRKSPFANHLSAVSEAVPALGWVAVEPTPAPYVKEMTDASMFYTNRVLKDYKDKDQTHVDWVKAWMQTLTQLHQYVRQNHTTGLVWNSAPGSSPSGGSTAPKASGGGPPPPPPPPIPTDLFANLHLSSNGGGDESKGGERGALFAEINQAGLDITKSLKKVTDDLKTHKNPALRKPGPPPPIAPKPGQAAGSENGDGQKKPAIVPDKPPVCALEGGKKWVVEFHKGTKQQPKQLQIEITDMKQTVYIYKCEFTVIVIKGKVNSLTMDSCKKTSCVFDNLLSCADVINCQSVQIQTYGSLPTLAIQKTDGCQVYLSRDALAAEIVTSKSSEMNILVPDESGEFSEHSIPEQFKTVWTGKALKTTVVDIA